MHCEELTEDVLLDIADRRIQGAPVEHLGRCPPCAERFLETSRIYETATVALQSAPPRALDARILREIPIRARSRRLLPALAASFIFAVACAWGILSVQPRPWPVHARALLPAPVVPETVRPAVAENHSTPTAPAPIMEAPVPATAAPALVSVEAGGDLNGDGRIDIADLMLLSQKGAQLDLNGDGKVDVADTMLLLRPAR